MSIEWGDRNVGFGARPTLPKILIFPFFMYVFIYLFKKDLRKPCYMPDVVNGTENIAVNKRNEIPTFMKLMFLYRDRKHQISK